MFLFEGMCTASFFVAVLVSREVCFITYAASKGLDQPAFAQSENSLHFVYGPKALHRGNIDDLQMDRLICILTSR